MGKTSEHTPGPWRLSPMRRPPIGPRYDDVDSDGNIFWGYSISGSNEDGGHILPTLAAVHNFPENIHANARLIAAAPDLLELALEVVTWADDRAVMYAASGEVFIEPKFVATARAAVSKAHGDSEQNETGK